MKPVHKSSRGFTLAEIVVTITVLGVLAIISFPIFTSIMQDSAQRAEDYNIACIKTGIELKKLQGLHRLALTVYQNRHGLL